MVEHKDPREQENLSDKDTDEYSFLQEVIKDDASDSKYIRKKILRITGYGIVLGVVASFVFCVVNPKAENVLGPEPAQIELSQEEKTQEEKTSEEEEKKEEEKEKPVVLDDRAYHEMLQVLNNTAQEEKKAMVILCHKGEKKENIGSGVIVADNGKELLILANAFQQKKEDTFTAKLADGKTYPVTLKKEDRNLKLAVYTIEKELLKDASDNSVKTISFGNSSLVESGDPVIVLGNVFGTNEAMTYGLVSAEDDKLELADGQYQLISTNIQTDHLGEGVILNKNGHMIGMISASALAEGKKNRVGGYAISDIKTVIELLSNDYDIPYIGIYGMDVSEELREKGMPSGVYVKEVAVDSPAMSAGIQSGDVIVQVGEQSVSDYNAYKNTLIQVKVGESIVIRGYRQGAGDQYEEIEFNVKVSIK